MSERFSSTKMMRWTAGELDELVLLHRLGHPHGTPPQAGVRARFGERLASARFSERAPQIPDKRERASADALQDRRPTDPPRLRVRMGATATASTNPTCVSASAPRSRYKTILAQLSTISTQSGHQPRPQSSPRDSPALHSPDAGALSALTAADR